MKPSTHPGDDFLVCYAAGGLPEPRRLTIRHHLQRCPRCMQRVCVAEHIGGLLLDAMTPGHAHSFSLRRCWQVVCGAIDDGATSARPQPAWTRP